MKNTLLKFLMILGLVFLPLAAQAASVAYLDFSIEGPHEFATITYDGVGGPLVGTNINITQVAAYDTNGGLVGNKLLINGGLLNFSTGLSTAPTTNEWNFGSGTNSFVTISGGIAALGIDVGTSLLWGTGSVMGKVAQLGSTFKVAILGFADEKNEELLRAFGLSEVDEFAGNLNLSFMGQGTPPGGFASTDIYSGDVINRPVPIPAAVWLLGTGLLGLFGVRRKIIK